MTNPIDEPRREDPELPIDPDRAVDRPRDSAHRVRDDLDVLAVIGIGGFFGTLARYGLGRVWYQPPTSFPLTTFVINASGALAIGIAMTAIAESVRTSRYLRPLTCIGFLGGWTTMSALAISGDRLVSTGHAIDALVYIGASAIVGPFASGLGIVSTRRLARRGHRVERQA